MWRRALRILPLLVLGAVPFLLLRRPEVRGALVDLVAFMRESGLAGLLVFLGVEAVVLSLTAPIWLMSTLAGYAYGFGKGFLIAWLGLTLGLCTTFLIGRFSIGKLLSQRAGEGQFWRAVDRAVRVEGLKITFLLRITFAIPQNLLTYVLSATPLSLRDFALGSAFGLLPITTFYVYLGASVESAAALIAEGGAAKGPLAWAALGLGLVLGLAALIWVSRIARRALDKTLAGAQKS